MNPAIVFTMILCCSAAMGATFKLDKSVTFDGQPDGSAAVATGPAHFIAACDEDNILRLYSIHEPSATREILDLNPLLGFPPKKSGAFRECDLEGAARIDNLVFWIGSHGRNKEGEIRENRRVLFATSLQGSGPDARLTLHGKPCRGLLDAMAAEPRLKSFKLAQAAEKGPETEGGLNIESLCADGDALLIGFRNPVEHGALLVPLLNPAGVAEGDAPNIGDPVALDLDGQGIRDMVNWSDRFLIVAGSPGDRTIPGAKPSRLFLWSGKKAARPVQVKGDFGDLNPESILVLGEGNKSRVLLLSDDGGHSFRGAIATIRDED